MKNRKLNDFEAETKEVKQVTSEAGTVVFRSVQEAIAADKYKRKLKKGSLSRVGFLQVKTKED